MAPPYLKSYVASESSEKDHSPVYRNYATKESGELTTIPESGATTIYENLVNAAKKYGDTEAIGSRSIDDIIEEVKEIEKKVDGNIVKEKKTWKFYQLSPYKWFTYNQLVKNANDIGAGLKHLGLGGDKRLALFAPTSSYWTSMVNAGYSQNITSITIYDTLGAEGLKHGLNECAITTVFTGADQLKVIASVVKDVPTLKNIICDGKIDEKQKQTILGHNDQIQFYTFDEMIELGKNNPSPLNPSTPDDIALIMYTSGTTGNPKGVILTHKNVIAVIAGVSRLIDPLVTPLQETYVSFLPLAHILAFSADAYCLQRGIKIAYGSPRTLTDASVRNCRGDLCEARPTLMVGVPQIYDSIRKGVLNKINKAGAVAQGVFDVSMKVKNGFSKVGLPTFLLDKLVFNKIREQVGGRVRIAVTGGAPISDEVREFFSNAVCPLLQGYGLTEVCGLACVNTPDCKVADAVGQISPCNEFKLVDVPEAGYSHTNKLPQGELWFRGNSVAQGYYNNEAATKEAFTEDGWFKTGDIVQLNDNYTLSIIDRKKNLVKLANGEYIALERLENIYRNVLYVQNICVCANSLKPKAVALIQPNMDAIKHFLRSNNHPDVHDLSDVSGNEMIKKEVYKALISEAKKNGFSGSELIADVFITDVEWTADNGLLTTSQKLKRKPIGDQFKQQLDTMYNKM
ncbi:acetyl-CoA synthetase-like protein [Neoconidiobolus thromboides FSU 785]|nr:acetyl-CoA synthetase-like protein [Neoconidiobolus thromboides FSU 785]